MAMFGQHQVRKEYMLPYTLHLTLDTCARIAKPLQIGTSSNSTNEAQYYFTKLKLQFYNFIFYKTKITI